MMMKKSPLRLLALASLAAAVASPVSVRADGVTDFVIDPTNGHLINAPGSYSLAADVVNIGDLDALTISADNVTLDLNGHTIRGGSAGGGINCGTSVGVVIRNGRVLNTPGTGVTGSGADCVVSDLTISDSFSSGILLTGNGCRATRCKANRNSYYGIQLGAKGVVDHCEAVGNNVVGTAAGISSGDGSLVENCLADGNSVTQGTVGNGVGIRVSSGSVVRNCIASNNNGLGTGSAYGIFADFNCTVENNHCVQQASGTTGVYAVGIRVSGSCKVINNLCNYNSAGSGTTGQAIGIDVLGGYGIVEGNTCDYNHAVGTDGSGRGIVVHNKAALVRGNSVTDNDAIGTGTSYGIYLTGAATGSTVEQNNCAEQSGGASAYGVFIEGFDVLVRGNSTGGNTSGGIRLNASGSVGSACRAERNRSSENPGVSAVGTHSLGTGEDANIIY